jgi:cysteinyl-tRNA synthetase, unknown class
MWAAFHDLATASIHKQARQMRVPTFMSGLFVIAGIAGAAVVVAPPLLQELPAPIALPARTGPPLSRAQSWGYQLQGVSVASLAPELDMMVVDYARDGRQETALKPSEVARLRQRGSSQPRIVLSYLSIGEAESYRFYWRPSWRQNPPPWLGTENATWRHNFAVQFWDAQWQNVIIKTKPATRLDELMERFWPAQKAYLDHIIDAGFDGVYLDRIDAYEGATTKRATARADMIAFVQAISAYAKARRPGFLIVPQNAEELLDNDGYLAAIDGVAKEDLLFGLAGDGTANDPEEISASTALLARVRAARKPVFVIEYLKDQAVQAQASKELRGRGFIDVYAARTLDQAPKPSPATSPLPAIQ